MDNKIQNLQTIKEQKVTKVLIVNFDKRWGGGQEYLLTLIKGLIQAVPRTNKDSDFSQFYIGQLVPPNSISETRCPEKLFQTPQAEKRNSRDNYYLHVINRKTLSGILALIKVLKHYQIIHIHREHDLWIGVLGKLLFNKKFVFSLHIHPKKRSLLEQFLLSFIYKLADKITCNSKYIYSLFVSIYGKEVGDKTEIVYPSIEAECMAKNYKTEENNTSIKEQPTLLMSGAYWKHQKELLGVMKTLMKNLPEAKLYFIAPSEDKKLSEELTENIKKEELGNHVQILPPRERNEYLKLLNSIDIFVYSFCKEPFGMAVLEAAILNKPIVAFAGGGVSEVLEGYENGHLVEYRDKQTFANKVAESFNSLKKAKSVDPQLNFSLNKNLLHKFSTENLVKKNIKLYESLSS